MHAEESLGTRLIYFSARGWLIVILIYVHPTLLAAQDVTFRVIEPDPASQAFPCPNQIVVYECHVWIDIRCFLPINDGATLRFLGGEMRGMTRSTPDGMLDASLTGSVQVEGSDLPLYYVNSTLVIQPPLDILTGSISSVTCTSTSDRADEERIDIAVCVVSDKNVSHVI